MTKRPPGSSAVAWVVLVWLLVLGPFAVFQGFYAPPPQGVLDGDDDDGAIRTVPRPIVPMVATTPSPPLPVPQDAGPVGLADSPWPPPSFVPVPRPARSPPPIGL